MAKTFGNLDSKRAGVNWQDIGAGNQRGVEKAAGRELHARVPGKSPESMNLSARSWPAFPSH